MPHFDESPIVQPTIGSVPHPAGAYAPTSSGTGQRIEGDGIEHALTETPKGWPQPRVNFNARFLKPGEELPMPRPSTQDVIDFHRTLESASKADSTLAEQITSRVINGLLRGESMIPLSDLIEKAVERGAAEELAPPPYRLPPAPPPGIPASAIYKPQTIRRRLER